VSNPSLSQSAIHAGAQMRPERGGGSSIRGPLTCASSGPGEGDDTVAPRQCGRCRAMFPGDPTLHPVALPEWWLCPLCRLALLGASPRRPATAGSPTPIGADRAR